MDKCLMSTGYAHHIKIIVINLLEQGEKKGRHTERRQTEKKQQAEKEAQEVLVELGYLPLSLCCSLAAISPHGFHTLIFRQHGNSLSRSSVLWREIQRIFMSIFSLLARVTSYKMMMYLKP